MATKAHETLPFEGRRISLVFYVSNAPPKARASLVKGLRSMKFCLPKGGRGAARYRPRVTQGDVVPETEDRAERQGGQRGDCVAPTLVKPDSVNQERGARRAGCLAAGQCPTGRARANWPGTVTKEGPWPSHRFP